VRHAQLLRRLRHASAELGLTTFGVPISPVCRVVSDRIVIRSGNSALL
jgi:hypothetical protein